jgi:hypothetical protein
MQVTQRRLDQTDLIVLVDRDGKAEWSSHRSDAEIVDMLRGIADLIEARQLEADVRAGR